MTWHANGLKYLPTNKELITSIADYYSTTKTLSEMEFCNDSATSNKRSCGARRSVKGGMRAIHDPIRYNTITIHQQVGQRQCSPQHHKGKLRRSGWFVD